MFDERLTARAAALLNLYRGLGLRIATAESCTGGLIAGLLTEIAGSSDVVERGFVVYSNDAKRELLGVSEDLLARHGAVSAPVARAMAEGALRRSPAETAIAVTGIAGPGGGTAQKPVGLVFLCCASRGGESRVEERRFGDIGRDPVRRATIEAALSMLEARAG